MEEMSLTMEHEGVIYRYTVFGPISQWSRQRQKGLLLLQEEKGFGATFKRLFTLPWSDPTAMLTEVLEPREVPQALRDAFYGSGEGCIFASFLNENRRRFVSRFAAAS